MNSLNILCCNPDGGAFYYIVEGWADAFRAMGHKFARWDGNVETLKKFKPHLYLGCSGWRQEFPDWARKEFGTKIGIHVNAWGSTKLKPARGEPDVNENPGARKWTLAKKPDFVFGYANDQAMKHMWDYWSSKGGFPTIPAPTAGNSVAHFPVEPKARFKCDVGFVGGRWAYKAININKYLVPVLKKTNSQVYGWGGWNNFPKYRGQINSKAVNTLFSSAKVCPSVVEPHTSRYGIDIPERMFKVPLAGGFTICDPVKNLEQYVPSSIFPMAKSPSEYEELIYYYIKNDELRNQLSIEQRNYILNHHTYFNRIELFLKTAGFIKQAKQVKQKIKN